MRPGPLTVLGIVDHSIELARRHPRFVLTTIVAGSLPLALGGAVAIHLIRTWGPDPVAILAGAAILAALAVPRAIGWGAGLRGLQAILDDEPVDPPALLRQALARAPRLYAAQAWPFMWALFGTLLAAGPVVIGIFASNPQRFFASMGLALAGSTAGTLAAGFVGVYVARRVLAVPIAATDPTGAGSPLRKSAELVRGQTPRAMMLLTCLALFQILVWITLVELAPWGLELAEMLTGFSFLELRGVLTFRDPSYLAFQGALAFLAMEPVRCLCAGLFHSDGETRRGGADLMARLRRRAPVPAGAPREGEAAWRG
ncbi:MAG TPA: hypothetical protein VGK61_09445 [Planctomycetota bacterium]|jgi:hypothetical protein